MEKIDFQKIYKNAGVFVKTPFEIYDFEQLITLGIKLLRKQMDSLEIPLPQKELPYSHINILKSKNSPSQGRCTHRGDNTYIYLYLKINKEEKKKSPFNLRSFFSNFLSSVYKDENLKYREDLLLKIFIHELIHSFQKYKYMGDGKQILSFNATNSISEEEYNKDLFRGLMEFGTELLSIRTLENSYKERSENLKTVTANPNELSKNHQYIKVYGEAITPILEFFQAKYTLSYEEIEKEFFRALMSGTIQKKYKKEFFNNYGKDSLRILSYLGSKEIYSLLDDYEIDQLEKKIILFFQKATSQVYREKLRKEIHQLVWNFDKISENKFHT